MRLPIAGVGLSIACSALPSVAQSPAPAATLGRVQFLDQPTETARGQFAPTPLPQFAPPGGRNPARQDPVNPMPNPGGQGPEVPPKPKQLPTGPKVDIERNGTVPPVGPGMPGVPGPAQPGIPFYPQPGMPGYTLPLGSYPAQPFAGQSLPYSVQPSPYAQPVPHGQPLMPYTGPTPVFGGSIGAPPTVVPGCDPSAPGGTGVPVSPSTPAVVGGGVATGPILDDPYLGGPYGIQGAGLFGFGGLPRARQALTSTVGLGSGRLNVTAEYLLWFVRAAGSPPLVTTSSPGFNGIIGQGDTRVLFGGEGQVLNNTRHSGARFGAVYYFAGNRWGVDGDLWFLARNSGSFVTDTNENPLLARPFVNANTGRNFSEVVAAPGLATGAVAINYGTSMWGANVDLRRGLFCGPCSRLDGIVGFRFANLSEDLSISESFIRTPGSNLQVGVPFAQAGVITDKFETINNFYGVNLGLAGEIRRGRWFAQGKATVGLGTIYQTAIISGSQRIATDTGGLLTANGGLLAIDGANVGRFTQARYGVMPEVGLTLGYYLTPRLRVGVGYGFVYMNRVLRPGGLIDTNLDVTRIPNFPLSPPATPLTGTPRPAVQFRETDFFAQGITFSLQWTW